MIVSGSFLLTQKPQEAEALITPVTANAIENNDSSYSYEILYADKYKLVYKETTNNLVYLKLLYKSTNLTDTVWDGKRVGFIGLLDSSTIVFTYQNPDTQKYIVAQYDLNQKTTTDFLAFDGPQTLTTNQFDKMTSLSPDRQFLAITHKSGIIIYALGDEKEVTILENHNCDTRANCIEYHSPNWLDNNTLLVYQSAIGSLTPMLVDTTGTIKAVLPSTFTQIELAPGNITFAGIVNGALFTNDTKRNSQILAAENNLKYQSPIWIDAKTIAVIANNNNLPTIVKTDKAGKKVVTLKEFSEDYTLSSLFMDYEAQTLYFIVTQVRNKSHTIMFYKMEQEEVEPKSFYSISKTL